MPTKTVTSKMLLAASRQAWKLDALLELAIQERVMPFLIGFDLDFLANEFYKAAKRMDSNA